jgi:hypothetical protein
MIMNVYSVTNIPCFYDISHTKFCDLVYVRTKYNFISYVRITYAKGVLQ